MRLFWSPGIGAFAVTMSVVSAGTPIKFTVWINKRIYREYFFTKSHCGFFIVSNNGAIAFFSVSTTAVSPGPQIKFAVWFNKVNYGAPFKGDRISMGRYGFAIGSDAAGRPDWRAGGRGEISIRCKRTDVNIRFRATEITVDFNRRDLKRYPIN